MKFSITLSCFLSFIALIFILFLFLSCGQQISTIESVEELDPYLYYEGSLKSGQTLAQALQQQGLRNSSVFPVLNSLNSIYDLRRSLPSDSFSVKVDTLEVIHSLRYFPYRDKQHIYSVIRDSLGTFHTQVDTLSLEIILRKAEGTISGSLYSSIRALREGPHIVVSFAEIFQWDIDFFVDPREGDRFSMIFEQFMLNGEFVQYGDIVAAEYHSRNYHKRAYRFVVDEGSSKYYDSKGESFQKAFLRSPLNYTRISSGFTTGRYHPILKIMRPHYGIDYAAPMNTPVVSVADGVVTHVGWKGGHPTVNGMSGGYGKTIMIRHPNGYETLYGHLNNYSTGIRVGTRVSQNQVIGYVGQTGLATGPHLHYEVHLNKRPMDPMKITNVAGPPVPDRLKGDFQRMTEKLDLLMERPVSDFYDTIIDLSFLIE